MNRQLLSNRKIWACEDDNKGTVHKQSEFPLGRHWLIARAFGILVELSPLSLIPSPMECSSDVRNAEVKSFL
jgi:hypothetical protein